MTITERTRLQSTLIWLKGYLALVDGLEEYVLFGSTALVLHGVLDREPGDIDVFVSRRVWGALMSFEDWHVETPKAGDPPILVNDTTPIMIHAFFDWSDEAADMDVPKLLKTRHKVYKDLLSYNVVSVREALRVKEAAIAAGAKVEKHIPDVEIIKEWLIVNRS